ncbi:hypothetical protein J4221_03915 [Candidatus Pacearchaeota archaeon]|nr:hypothetical protein [Candidatus Pacearchaeota archaeon]
MKNVKIVVFVPVNYTEKLLEVIGKNGGGKIGNYSYCSFITKGEGRFNPNNKAKPFIGEKDKIEKVDENKIEFICPKEKAEFIIEKIRETHPYEEPAIDILPLIDEEEL